MKRAIQFFLNVFLPCLLVFGTVGYTTMTDAQLERYFGMIVWKATTLTEDDLALIDSNSKIRPVEALADSYGRWYHFIIGSASTTTSKVYTRAVDVAGFTKCSVQMYYSFANSSDVDDVTQDCVVTTGKGDVAYLLYGSTFPAARLDDATPSIAAAMPVGPYIAGATVVGVSASAADTSLLRESIEGQLPIRSPNDMVSWNGITAYDLSGIASLVLEVSPAGSGITGSPTTCILVRVTR